MLLGGTSENCEPGSHSNYESRGYTGTHKNCMVFTQIKGYTNALKGGTWLQ